MDISTFHLNIKIKLDKTSSLSLPSFEPEELDFWINDAIDTFVKQRSDGLNIRKTGVEENQRRIDDLRTIILSGVSLKTTPLNTNSYYENNTCFTLPSNYFRYLGDQAEINVNGTVSRVGSITTNADTLNIEQIEDPYSKHYLHHQTAKPIRMLRDDEILYISDGTYSITDCYLTYIRKPAEVDLTSNVTCDLPESVHSEIVNIAVKKILENIESQRYMTFSNETLASE